MSSRLSLRTALAVSALLTAPLAAQWKVPDPATATHPGATEAPASSPKTYADAAGFKTRSQVVIDGLAGEDLQKWRTGYFAGGDPGKYLPGAAMAKLLKNPADETARKYMNDDRSAKEWYHFAAVNWGRYLPLFKDTLTEDTLQRASKAASSYGFFGQGGTENHKTMWMTTANVVPLYLPGGRISNRNKDDALKQAKSELRTYVKGLYAAGQGEWDSCTYLMFTMNGMMNIYDFAEDPEVRLLAKAALDWFAAGFALKYTDGVYCGPHQRGWSGGPAESIADQTGYVWWGSSKVFTPEEMRNSRYALHAITSSYRPNAVICNLAHRKLPKLPFENRNTKPSYWGISGEAKIGAWAESVYVTPHFTMGGLWKGFGGQATRFNIVAASPVGGVVFTAGSPSGRGDAKGEPLTHRYEDGNGRYDRSCQVGGAFLVVSNIPADDPTPYAFASVPPEATKPVQKGAWWVMQAGKTYVGVYGLGAPAVLGETDLSPKQIEDNEKAKAKGSEPRNKPAPILRSAGTKTGLIVQAADVDSFPTLDAFAAALQSKCKVDNQVAGNLAVGYTGLDGRKVALKWAEEAPEVTVDGQTVDVKAWTFVYDGPYLSCKDGVLSVNDGKDGFVVDFTGDLPVYKAWKK